MQIKTTDITLSQKIKDDKYWQGFEENGTLVSWWHLV
jgi:hypothetical protein